MREEKGRQVRRGFSKAEHEREGQARPGDDGQALPARKVVPRLRIGQKPGSERPVGRGEPDRFISTNTLWRDDRVK